MEDAADELFAHFASKALVRDPSLLFKPNDAAKVLLAAQAAGLALLGLEGFHVMGDGIKPDLGWILDSCAECWDFKRKPWSLFIEATIATGLQFLQSVPDKAMVFDIALASEQEFAELGRST